MKDFALLFSDKNECAIFMMLFIDAIPLWE